VVPVDLGMMVGEDAAVDVEAEPDRWLRFDCTGPRGRLAGHVGLR